jgi:hypothetical protein
MSERPGGSPALARSARSFICVRGNAAQARLFTRNGGILQYVLRQLAAKKAA